LTNNDDANLRAPHEITAEVENGAAATFVKDAVRVIRAGQSSSYVVVEEHDDGSLLLRPDTSDRAIVETAPGSRGASVATRQRPLAAQPNVILEVPDLSVAYGAKKAVDNVSLQVTRGEIFGLLGSNGAGKTSTLSAIEGLVKPKSGMVLLDGIDIRRHPTQAKAKDQAVQAAVGWTTATALAVHRGHPRTGLAAARRADGRSRSSVAPAALDPARAPPRTRRQHRPDDALDGGGPSGV
jgi:ABC-type glutathione transport system ATPase component